MLHRFIPALGLALLVAACADGDDPIEPQMSLVDVQGRPAASTLYAVVRARNASGFTWAEALNAALSARVRGRSGGHLATIASQAENDIVAALVARSPSPCWIGAFQFGTYVYEFLGGWYLADAGTPALTWANWASGEPDHAGFSAAAIQADGTWLDAPNSSTDYYSCYVVEIDP